MKNYKIPIKEIKSDSKNVTMLYLADATPEEIKGFIKLWNKIISEDKNEPIFIMSNKKPIIYKIPKNIKIKKPE